MPKSVLRYTVIRSENCPKLRSATPMFLSSGIKVPNKSLSHVLNNVFILVDVVVAETNRC